MTCRPNRALLPALLLALAGCGGGGAAQADPDNWRAMLARGDGVGAETLMRRELAHGARKEALAPFLGEAAIEQGDFAAAEQWLGARRFAPDVAGHGFRMLGKLRMQQGDLAAAGQAFDHALASGLEQDPALWADIGRLRFRGGEQAQALAASNKALGFGANDPEALLFAAQLARDAHGNFAALPLLERALRSAPANPDLLGEYAATLGEVGRASDMLAAVRRLAVVAPGDRRVLWLQAVLAARAGQPDLARTLLQRGGDLDRQVPAAILLLALVDFDSGNPDSAAQGLDRLLRIQPDNDRVARLLARALALGGHHRELIARFDARADVPYFAQLVGRAYENLGERDKAAAYLDRARATGPMRLAMLPGSLDAQVAEARGAPDGASTVGLVRALLGDGKLAEARAKADAFVARFPGSADALSLAGDAALASGDAKAALARYRAAGAIRRPWPLTRRMVAALDRSGDGGGATALLARHLAGEPYNADAAAMLARRLGDAGDAVRARAVAMRARTLGRNDAVVTRLAAGR